MTARTLAKKITLVEAARRWGWSVRTVQRKVAAGQVPHIVIAGRVWFEPEVLDAWEEQQRRWPKDAAPPETPKRSRDDECAALGIAREHQFS